MTQLFNGANFVYHSVEVYRTFRSYLQVLQNLKTSTMAAGITINYIYTENRSIFYRVCDVGD